MDELGQRIIRDKELIREKRKMAHDLERRARQLRDEANETERLLELARSRTTPFPTTKIISESNPR